jgi:DNA polymerase elongation subunit (family B)
MIVTIYKIRYEVAAGKTLVHLFGRGEDGNRVHKILEGMRAYFYIPKGNKKPTNSHIVEIVEEGVDIDNNPLWKVYVDFPFNVPNVRSQCPVTYEADIPFEDRVRYDLGIVHTIDVPNRMHIKPEEVKPIDVKPIPPHVCILDIENFDGLGLALPKYPTAEVYVVGIFDKANNAYTILYTEGSPVNYDKVKEAYPNMKINLRSYKDERTMFKALVEYFRLNPPDIMVNWNINYDLDYLRERAKTNTRSFTMVGWEDYARMDAMQMYLKRFIGTPDDLHLDYVAKQELGEGKVEREEIHKMYKKDMTKLVIYNIKDLVLVDKIMVKKDLYKFYVGLAQKVGSSVENFGMNSVLADSYFLHKCHGHLVLPTRENLKSGEGIDKGATVLLPFSGVIRKAIYLDLKTAYPNAVRTLNISQETFVKNPDPNGDYFKAPSGRCYSKAERGLVPILYDQLVDERYQLRDKMHKLPYGSEEYKEAKDEQEVVKFFTNSLYGVMGSDYFRLNSGKVGSDITGTVRAMIQWVIDILERSGFKVWYGDTDGLLFTFPNSEEKDLATLKKWCDKAVAHINSSFSTLAKRFNADTHLFEIKLETINEVVFQWGRKKRYIQVPLWDGKDISNLPVEERLIVKGAHSKRRDSSQFTKKLQRTIFAHIVENRIDEIRSLVKSSVEAIERGTVDTKELAIPTGWKKDYGTNVPQLRAAFFSNKHLGKDYKRGDTFWMYLGSSEGKPPTDVLALDWNDDPEGFNVQLDIPANVRRHIILPAEPILEALGMSVGEILAGVKRTTLDEYLDTGSDGYVH